MNRTYLLGFTAVVALLSACVPPQKPVVTQAPPAPAPRKYAMADLRIPDSVMDAPKPDPMEPRPTDREAQATTDRANRDALDLPTLSCFSGKDCEYWYVPKKWFKVYTKYADMTLVCLHKGETVNEVVIPGDQVYVKHMVYSSGKGKNLQTCVSLMPAQVGLNIQGSIFASDHKYDLNIQSFKNTKHVQVDWKYPDEYLRNVNGMTPVGEPGRPTDPRERDTDGMAPRDRYCGYRITGDTPEWRPVPTPDGQPAVCDDGEVTTINFKPAVLGAYGDPSLWRVDDGVRKLVQVGRMNSTFRVAGIHEHLLLNVGATEVHIDREPKQ